MRRSPESKYSKYRTLILLRMTFPFKWRVSTTGDRYDHHHMFIYVIITFNCKNLSLLSHRRKPEAWLLKHPMTTKHKYIGYLSMIYVDYILRWPK